MPISGFLIMVFALKQLVDVFRDREVEAPASAIPTAE